MWYDTAMTRPHSSTRIRLGGEHASISFGARGIVGGLLLSFLLLFVIYCVAVIVAALGPAVWITLLIFIGCFIAGIAAGVRSEMAKQGVSSRDGQT